MKCAFIIAVIIGLSGCRVAYPSIGVKAATWQKKCITDYRCYRPVNSRQQPYCRPIKVCYHR